MAEEKIRPSATVILWRRAPALEVFLVERSTKTRFFPGYHAFPGGVVDAEDGEGETGRLRAALRELQEEVGVKAEPEALVPAGRLVTPPFGPTRYDTSFYVCELPHGQSAHVAEGELTSGAWVSPADALTRWSRTAMPIPPPTLAYLRLLAQHGDAVKAAEAARATDGRPHHERFRIEIHPGVYVLPLRTATLPPATTQNCYILDSDPIIVIDPGSDRSEEHVALFHHLDAMTGVQPGMAAAPAGAASMRADGREILVVLTHHHHDHVGAVQAVQDRYGVRVMASDATRDALPPHFVDGIVAEGHVFDLGTWEGRSWRLDVLHTPGHTPGHLALRDLRFGALFAGDLVSGVSTILIDPGEGDMGHYLASLERCIALEPPLVLPGHGPAMPRDALRKTLEHRLMREAKVLGALTDEPRTAGELVPIAYDDAPAEAWPLAERSLRSHLDFLVQKGDAVETGGGWKRSGTIPKA